MLLQFHGYLNPEDSMNPGNKRICDCMK